MATALQLTGHAIGAWRGLLARTDPDAAYARALARYHRQVGRARTAVFACAVAAAASLLAAGGTRWWLCVTALAGWFGAAGWRRLRRLAPPNPADAGLGRWHARRAPVLAVQRGAGLTRSASLGGPEDVTDRLAVVESQLARVVPAVRRLHPGAATELMAAVREAAPVLAAQVERLSVLASMAAQMPGTSAAAAAERSAQQVAERVAAGVAAYERLLAAAAQLLGAPELGRDPGEVLAPAVQAMTAYSHGLEVATGTAVR